MRFISLVKLEGLCLKASFLSSKLIGQCWSFLGKQGAWVAGKGHHRMGSMSTHDATDDVLSRHVLGPIPTTTATITWFYSSIRDPCRRLHQNPSRTPSSESCNKTSLSLCAPFRHGRSISIACLSHTITLFDLVPFFDCMCSKALVSAVSLLTSWCLPVSPLGGYL